MSVCIFSFLVINSLFGDEITVKQSDICRCFWHKCFFTTSSGLEESNHVKSDFYAAILKLNKSIWKRLWMIDWLLRCCRCGKTVWSKNNQTETMSSYPTTTKPDLFLQAQPCLLHLESLTIGDFRQRQLFSLSPENVLFYLEPQTNSEAYQFSKRSFHALYQTWVDLGHLLQGGG